MARIFVCDSVLQQMQRCIPSTQKAWSHCFYQLSQDYWHSMVSVRNIGHPQLPEVFEFQPRRGSYLFASLSCCDQIMTWWFWAGHISTREGKWVSENCSPFFVPEHEIKRTYPKLTRPELKTLSLSAPDGVHWLMDRPWVEAIPLKNQSESIRFQPQVGHWHMCETVEAFGRSLSLLYEDQNSEAAAAKQPLKVPFKGHVPLVVKGLKERDMVRVLQGWDPSSICIVTAMEKRKSLSTYFPSIPVWSPELFANVGNKNVLLWQLMGLDQTPISPDSETDRIIEPSIMNILARIFEQVRNGFVIYEGEQGWKHFQADAFRGRVLLSAKHDLMRSLLVEPNSVSSRHKLGRASLENGCEHMAAAYFYFLADQKFIRLAEAQILAHDESFEAAGKAFCDTKDWALAAQCYEQANCYEEALFFWTKAGNNKNRFRLRIALLGMGGSWLEVASAYKKAQNWHAAIRAYLRVGSYREVASIYVTRLGMADHGLEYYRMAKDDKSTAQLLAQMGRFKESIAYFRRIGDQKSINHLLTLLAGQEKGADQERKWGDQPPIAQKDVPNSDRQKSSRGISSEQLSKEQGPFIEEEIRFNSVDQGALILENSGSYLEAGNAYLKIGRFDKALECFLKTKADAPHFVLAKKVFPRVKDQGWILDLADELLEGGDYQQARILYEKLDITYKLGFVAAMGEEDEEALNYWKELEDAQEFNEVCSYCLRHNKLKLGATLVLHVDPCFPFWYKGMINKFSTPAIFNLMEAYLERSPIPEEILKWASRLQKRDRFGVNTYSAFVCFEKGHYYDLAILMLLERSEAEESFQDTLNSFRRDLESEALGATGAAIRHFFLKHQTQYLSALQQIDLDENNAAIFLLDWAHKGLVQTYISSFNLSIKKLPKPIRHPLLVALAEKATANDFGLIAATCFLLMGELDQACRLYLAQNDLSITTWLYELTVSYGEMLSLMKSAKEVPYKELAKLCERMHRFNEAAEYYLKVGDAESARRCRSKA